MSIKIGTRSSPLARLQAERVAIALRSAGLHCNICPHTTTADRFLDKPLTDIGGKALFSRELDLALLAGEVDICVHSLKDLETELHQNIEIAATLKRDNPSDMFVLADDCLPATTASDSQLVTWHFLPKGAIVATCAPRREAFLRNRRPDLKIVSIRGNIERRLAIMQQENYHAIVLASATFLRTGRSMAKTKLIDHDQMLPASTQGVIAVVATKQNASKIQKALQSVHDTTTFLTSQIERTILYTLGCNCHSPVAAFARLLPSRQIVVRAAILAHNGHTIYTTEATFVPPHDPLTIGKKIGKKLLKNLPVDFIRSLKLQPNC